MPQLTIHIELPSRVVSSPRTQAVAADFEMTETLDRGLCVLAPTPVTVSPGELVYLIGPSGSGKSQVLRTLAANWPGPVVAGALGQSGRRAGRRAVIDSIPGRLDARLRLLCHAGLAEPRLWLNPPDCLSAGQSDRLTLARLFAAAERRRILSPPPGEGRGEGRDAQRREQPRTTNSPSARPPSTSPPPRGRGDILLAIDEFGSRLDRLTAAVLAANLRRWLRRVPDVAVIVATAHDDLDDALAPDQVWVKTCDGTLVRHRRQGSGVRDQGDIQCVSSPNTRTQ